LVQTRPRPPLHAPLDTEKQGRPPIGPQVRALVREMATANPLWGAPRIHGELRTLAVQVSERTVSRLLGLRTRPAPQRWKTFLTNHLVSAASMDFFADTHWSRPRRGDRVVARSSPRHAFQQYGASSRRVDRPTSRRRIAGRHRSQVATPRSTQHQIC